MKLSAAALKARRKGGRVRSEAKGDSARANGGRGGRPPVQRIKPTGLPDAMPRGPADIRIFWPFVLRRILDEGRAGELRFVGNDCELTTAAGGASIRFPRMARAVRDSMPSVFIGAARRCRLRRECDGMREECALTATGEEVVSFSAEPTRASPIPPPSPSAIAKLMKRELAKTRRTVAMLRKLGASDHEIAASMGVATSDPCFG